MVKDQNGRRVARNIKREGHAWGVTVWFGGVNGLATNVRRYLFRTRKEARGADISDVRGNIGRVRGS